MPRYIWISFLFLAWVFYEASGGADFTPGTEGQPQVAEAPGDNATGSLIASAAAEPASAPDPRNVNIVSLITARADRARPQPAPQPDPLVIKTSAEIANASRRLPTIRPVSDDGDTTAAFPDSTEREVKVASLGDMVMPASLTDAPELVEVRPVAPTADIRRIVATRVNMRAGPGTQNDVLVRLDRGQEVEVLGSDDSGWLRLRTLPGDQVGWIAARLVGPAEAAV